MSSTRKGLLTAVVCLTALMLVTFWKSLDPSLALFTSDDSLGLLHYWKSTYPQAWLAYWMPDNLVSLAGGQALFTPSLVLLWLLPTIVFVNWIYALDAFGTGCFFFLFLRRKNVSPVASLLGAIVYCYCSCNFSLVYSGHIGKFGNYLYFAATLWALEHALQKTRAWSWWVATGAFLGFTISEQPDVAILFVLLFSAYLAFRILSQPGQKLEAAAARTLGFLVLVGILSGVIAANVIYSQYQSQVKGVAQLSEPNRQQAWNWATQWSFPPEETLALVSPGFFGWKNDDPHGPYWGRTGRSAEYDTTTKQGFPRFALSTTYFGVVPIFLAAAMGAFAFRTKYRDALDPPLRRELIFWSVVALVTVVLAFGRYFVLYHFFYALPKMNIIRNPNKFLHLFSVAAAVLSAHGLHQFVESRNKAFDTHRFWIISAGCAAVALLVAVCLFASNDSLVAHFHGEFKDGSAAIVSTMTDSLLRLAVSCGILAVLWFWLERLSPSIPRLQTSISYLIVLLATVDLYITNRHYIEYHEYKPLYAENDLVRFLKSDPEPQRSQLLTRGGFYNLWLTIYFPYYRIQTLDIAQLPRMPVDYQQFLGALQGDPLRLWQLTNCKYLLGPLGGWQQIQSDPLIKPYFDLAFAYNIALSNNSIVTSPARPEQFNANTQVVIRYNRALPRVRFYDRWRAIEGDNECLRTLAAKDFDAASEVIVSDPVAAASGVPPSSASVPKIEWLHRTDNVADLRVTTDRRGILLFNEKFDPAFVVTVDGKPSSLLRCNFLMKGALVEAGTHEVRFEYRPPRIGIYLSLVGWAGCLVAIVGLRSFESRSAR